jgi:hypothetical protein
MKKGFKVLLELGPYSFMLMLETTINAIQSYREGNSTKNLTELDCITDILKWNKN